MEPFHPRPEQITLLENLGYVPQIEEEGDRYCYWLHPRGKVALNNVSSLDWEWNTLAELVEYLSFRNYYAGAWAFRDRLATHVQSLNVSELLSPQTPAQSTLTPP